jgi:hypothetical protein
MDPILIVAICAGVFLAGTFIGPAIKAKVDAKKAANAAPKGATGDIVASMTGDISAFLKSLGIVQDIEQLHGEVQQIAAYGAIVLIQPHVLDVVATDQQAATSAAFAQILASIGTKAQAK